MDKLLHHFFNPIYLFIGAFIISILFNYLLNLKQSNKSIIGNGFYLLALYQALGWFNVQPNEAYALSLIMLTLVFYFSKFAEKSNYITLTLLISITVFAITRKYILDVDIFDIVSTPIILICVIYLLKITLQLTFKFNLINQIILQLFFITGLILPLKMVSTFLVITAFLILTVKLMQFAFSFKSDDIVNEILVAQALCVIFPSLHEMVEVIL